jgi:ApaG protein
MPTPIVSDITTNGLRIGATAFFLEHESCPNEIDGQPPQYVWGYRVLVLNNSEQTIKLLGRKWTLIDADGKRQDVSGQGLMGLQPTLKPGQSFRYVASCPLPTHWGTMEGSIIAETPDGQTFDAEVGRFYLVSAPRALSQEVIKQVA